MGATHIQPKGCASELGQRDHKVSKMARTTIEEKALRALAAFERAGRSVSRVTLDGRKIEFVLKSRDEADEFERIDMRHGKT
jgi:hypothetical protein